jgi:hypothetical protein
VLPAGSGDSAEDRPGLQVSLPFSKQVRDVYLHGNVAATWIQGVQLAGGARKDLTSPLVAGSVIWRMRPMLNLLLEAVFESDATLEQQERVGHQSRTTISPGFRRGWNIGAKQLVVGAALPVTIESDAADTGLFAYFSYELPFRKQP